MHRLVQHLNSGPFAEASPITQASFAHYALVNIHPFADGNGRVARALGSVYLYRAARVPLIIFLDDRVPYLDALAAADRGERHIFVEFSSDAAIASVELVLESLRTASSPSAYERIEEFRKLLTVQGGLTYTDLDQVAINLIQQFQRILSEEVPKLLAPNGVHIAAGSGGGGPAPNRDNYRGIVAGGSHFVTLQLTAPAPAEASRSTTFHALVSLSRNEDADLFAIVQENMGPGATLALRDVYPSLTTSAELRLRMFSERVLGIELDGLLADARNSLLDSGYVDPLERL